MYIYIYIYEVRQAAVRLDPAGRDRHEGRDGGHHAVLPGAPRGCIGPRPAA